MKEGCESFISGWEDELIKVLVNRTNAEEPVQKLCYEITKACENVNPANVKPMDDTIMIDGQPQKIVNLNYITNI